MGLGVSIPIVIIMVSIGGMDNAEIKNGQKKDKNNESREIESQSILAVENNCDSSYPDVCIPTWPPDLDCSEISYSNFKVLQPDQHNFDRNKNGIGCEN